MPPLGLLTVAALLPRHYEVRLVDTNVAPLRPQDVDWADLVFVSAMIVQKSSFDEAVRMCNERGRVVVAGGPYPSLEPGCPAPMYRDAAEPDIKHTPVPRFDLVKVGLYETMPVQYSRGCPFECE